MPKCITKEEAYSQCESEGMFLPQKEKDVGKIKSMLQIAEEDLKTIAELKQKSDRFNTAYKLSYDVLHTLTEAFLLFDRIKSANHQCLFAYLCINHPEFDFDWNFFEKVRIKRNGINYYGAGVGREEWKEICVQIEIYTSTLKRKIVQMLEE